MKKQNKTFIEKLIERPTRKDEFPHSLEVFNKMTNKERKEWNKKAEKQIKKEGLTVNMHTLHDKALEFQLEYFHKKTK